MTDKKEIKKDSPAQSGKEVKNTDKSAANTVAKSVYGEKKKAIGEAYALDGTNSKLKVSFFKPFYGDYWIIDLDDAYT